MKFAVVGINHDALNIDKRKNFYFRDSDKLAFCTKLLDQGIEQTLILSTCNRSEVYVVVDDFFDENQLKTAFLSYFHQKNDQVYVYSHLEAISHLLRVACGLESMVIGEDQILHQIREALNWTLQQKFSGKELNFIFQRAIAFARTMRQEHAISEHPLSVSYIGYRQLKPLLKPDDKIMICGMGEMALLMIEYLKDYHLVLVNRTYAKVEPYLNEKNTYVPFEKRYEALPSVNAVVTATSSPHTIFEKEYLPDAHPLIFLDLAMPRDVGADVRELSGVQLFDMDNLQEIANASLEKRKAICELIDRSCQEEKYHILNGLQEMKSDSLIQKMQSRYLDISDETYELLSNKLDLTTKEAYILKKVLKTSFLRLLKEPVRMLKSADEKERTQYLEVLSKMLETEDESK